MRPTRRRVLTLCAASLVAGAASAAVSRHRFRALGADCVLTLPGTDAAAAQAARAVQAEVAAIEREFSLWMPQSALSRLNRTGHLARPGVRFRQLAALARSVSARTGGAFDVTVQARWTAIATGRDPADAPLGWQSLVVSRRAARLRRPGLAATFNGIAQGFAADRAVTVLRRHGYRDLLVDLGEHRGLGQHPEGRAWRLGAAAPGGAAVAAVLDLDPTGGAVATSAPHGTLIGGRAHIIDPLDRPGPRWASVTVVAEQAALADAVSTAVAATPMAEAAGLLLATGTREAVLIAPDGKVTRWQARDP